MPKVKISEFDIDPANNTDINNINIAEGCAPSGINNAIRQLMSDLKEFQTGAGGDPFNGAVNGTVGATTPATGAFTTLSASSTVSGTGFSTYLASPPAIGGSTPAAGAFTSLSASGAFSANGGTTLGDASGDALTINSSAVSIPNGLNFDSNTLVIDATNNRVGIGTASPSSDLEVISGDNTDIRVNTTASGYLQLGQFTNGGFIGTSSTDATAGILRFGAGNAERLRITTGGNLGIGTTNASERLVVQSGSILIRNDTDYLKFNNAADSTYWGRISQSSSDIELSNRQAGALKFLTTDTERMRIDSGGRVLLGGTSSYNANSKLQVTSANIGVDNGAGGQAILAITADAFAANAGASLGLGGKASGGGNIVFGAIAGRSEGTGNAGYLQFATINSGGTMSERMRITSTGAVGIGTSSPAAARLQVTGTGTTALSFVNNTDSFAGGTNFTQPHFAIGSGNDTTGNVTRLGLGVGTGAQVFLDALMENGTTVYSSLLFRTRGADGMAERMRITSAGNVGIGISDPSEKLDVRGIFVVSDANKQFVRLRMDSGVARIESTFASGASGAYRPLAFSTSDAERMRIDTSGNVGIGTSSPTTKFDVAGVNGEAIQFRTGTRTIGIGSFSGRSTLYAGSGTELSFDIGGERMRLDSSGNLGLGVTPSAWGGGGRAFEMGFVGNGIQSRNAQFLMLTQNAWYNSSAQYIYGSNGLATRYDQGAGTHKFFIAPSGTAGNAITFTQAMTLTANSELLVGATTRQVQGKVEFTYDGNVAQGLNLIETTAVTAATAISFVKNSATQGNITVTASATAYNTTSDYRLKTVVGSVDNAGQRLDAIEPVEYDWKAGGRTRGFLAHKFAEVYPNSVTGEKDAVDAEGNPVYQSMQASSSEVMADLIAEIQSLRKRVALLESK
jgi:hypothetical protein